MWPNGERAKQSKGRVVSEGSRDESATAARVAATLTRIRASVRQRHALLATIPDEALELPASLAAVEATRQIEVAMPTSHRPVVGAVLVLAKKAVYHVFLKWYFRGLLQQQNAFNRAVSVALQDAFERQQRLLRALAEDDAGTGPAGDAGDTAAGSERARRS